jgi:hypothetical protein
MRLPNRLAVLLAAVFGLAAFSARAEPAPEDNLSNYLQLLRTDVGAAKVQAVNEALRLPESEADVFWPIYREYDHKLAKLSDQKVALIREFVAAQERGVLEEAQAHDIAKRWFEYQEGRLALWREYYGKMEKSLGAVRAAQFLQLEHQLALFLDLAVASEIPAVNEPARSPPDQPAPRAKPAARAPVPAMPAK